MCIKQTWRFPRLFFYSATRENYGRYRVSVDNPVRLHHYEGTSWTFICSIIFDILPDFLEELKKL